MSRGLALTRGRAQARTGSMAEQMAVKIAAMSNDGDELVNFAFRVFRDTTMPFSERQWAFEWLSDRGAGKAMGKVEVTGHVSTGATRMNLEDYTFEEMAEIERIQRAAAERKRIEQATDANTPKVIDAVLPPVTP